MNAMLYFYSRKFKNKVKEILSRPFELVIFLLFVGMMIFSIIDSNSTIVSQQRDINELYAIVFALYAFAFVLTAKKGFSNGATMFSMADVNLVFTSPRKSETVLFYGLFSQLGKSILLAAVIFYQYPTVKDIYGVDFSFLLAVIVGYALVVFLSQMLAMVIYCLTCDSDRKTKIAKIIFYGIIVLFAAITFFKVYKSDNFILSVSDAINMPYMKYFPVVGFIYYGVIGFAKRKLLSVLVALAYFLLFCAAYCVIIRKLNADFYEDVLKATEVSFSAITAQKEGKASTDIIKNVKVGKTGLKKGFGANTIYQKHKTENRRGKVFSLDAVSIFVAVLTNGFAFFLNDSLSAFVFSVYMSLFTVGKGRWAKELRLPYVYLIPEPSYKKLFYVLKEQLPTLFVQSVVNFAAFYFILNSSIFEIVSLIFANMSFSFLFIGVNLIFQRFFGSHENKTLTIFLYVFVAMFLSLGFVATFFVFYVFLYYPLSISLSVATTVNIIISLITLFLCRNVLECAEYNNK